VELEHLHSLIYPILIKAMRMYVLAYFLIQWKVVALPLLLRELFLLHPILIQFFQTLLVQVPVQSHLLLQLPP
jgi:hypothetical protein